MAIRHTRIPVRTNPVAHRNSIFRTKTQNYGHHLGEEAKHWAQYERCVGKRIKKGKMFYHPRGADYHELADAGAGGIGKCKSYYKRWQKALSKLGESAAALKAKREGQMKLTASAEHRLDRTEDYVENTHDRQTLSSKELARKRKKAKTKRAKKLARKGFSASATEVPSDVESEDVDGTPEEEEGMDTQTMALFAAGGLVLAGGAYWLLTRD